MNSEIEAYLNQFDKDVQDRLRQVDSIIRQLIPDAEDCIKYGIPSFVLHGQNMVHYAGYKKHVGFYPTPNVIAHFKDEYERHNFKWAKGSVQFPNDQPLPIDLIKSMIVKRLE